MIKFISHNNFIRLLAQLNKDYRVYVPVKREDKRFYGRFENTPTEDIVIGEVRAFEPLKAFFFKGREKVADGFKADMPSSGDKPFAIVGVKACDLKGFKVQDYVFSAKSGTTPDGTNNDDTDPFYLQMRDKNLIISSDCTCVIDTCFCLALGVKPYPQDDFDINLSQINGGFIVESSSEKGEKVIQQNLSLMEESTKGKLSERDKQRDKVVKQIEKNIQENDIPSQKVFEGIIEKNYDSGIWEEEAKTCVECGACNTICPTCHCFLLYDQKDAKKMARFRIWDSCMVKDFARVAGGANPRHKLWMRLRNRFEKKFDFFPKVANLYACTGCGRCISACPAKIDIRKVLKKLVDNKK
ncbi:MAG: 4Fe-4S dicluster domain-containing protein [Candidatus Omnitrophica bacterium]|nr:4Fe-4S dicluster domain-containing protein [Candidatus Omnitrophota bacterium]MBU1047300.1 4Fe-4S dicluster domain-containing protein [Candidatus Omnitrophota bacterium]MBU1630223.1 4Fe-4S dicluster domain-containing protein [Candidatus Omnitrophota bacterium]MBU1767365.1 4Fe-4S dicluster domain-containing protein [Candidatus Omnitrophota bacterium]MBU1889115.1 4Fe-4S dicluster domain-containing protein [Candidatus Omnitrophota bacterium]